MRAATVAFLALTIAVVSGLAGSGGGAAAREGGNLEGEFRAAAAEHGVPADLLKAMGYVNTRWEMPPPEASDYEKGATEGRGQYGIMALTRNPSKDTLGRAARLTGLSAERLKNDRAANIRGAAAVLADIQGERKPRGINGWYEAVSEYGDGVLYANQVYETLRKGAEAEISSGERVRLRAHPEAETREVYTTMASADYGRATWYGAHPDNYTDSNRERSYDINRIVIHVTQGSWSSAINWFKDGRAQVSAHYTVRSSDGKIGQSVREADIAWHAGNWDYNTHSIGIEHEGYVSQKRWFTDAMYRSSARLAAYLCKKYRIPIDRKHIIGHNQVPGADHTDPGPYWNWERYMRLVRSYAGSSTYTQVVDNSSPRFSASRAWDLNTWNPQKYGKNYRAAKPRNVNDPARYRIKIPRRGKYAVFAWWPANAGYNQHTRYTIRTVSGWQKRVVNQEKNGGRWVKLGTYTLAAGDRVYVRVHRDVAGRDWVIADAVRVKRVG